MINITNETGKRRILNELTLLQNTLERAFEKELRLIIRRQFNIAARLVANGEEDELERIINGTRQKLINTLERRYRIVASVSNKKVTKELEKSALIYELKGASEDFWRILNGYITNTALRRAKGINTVTKKAFKLIINKGLTNGDSPVVISQSLRKSGLIHSAFRAKRIARTEVHSSMTFSMQQTAKATKLLNEKEWVSAKDDRTRFKPFNHLSANGEKVSMEESYYRTGEALKVPGDEEGSAGNVINCRCIEIYHTGT